MYFLLRNDFLLNPFSEDNGLIPRLINKLFIDLDVINKKDNKKYTVYCSYLQVYNEKIYDLLEV